MIEICNISECTACGVCATVCPQSCITYAEDRLGRNVPIVDDSRCIKCKLCERTCHNNLQLQLSPPSSCYAMRYEGKSASNSTSGAISYLLSLTVLSNSGVIYGASFEKGTVRHIRIDSIDQVNKIQGSKYVRSIIDGKLLLLLKKDALDGRRILFTGTACQIAAVKLFLKYDYQNVYFLEVLCHGTPPSTYLEKYYHKYVSIIPDQVKFRNKDKYIFELYVGDKLVFGKDLRNSMYIQGFLHDIILDPSCYSCRYVGRQRVGDLTIGDYWGFLLNGERCSAVMANSPKGEQLLLDIKSSCVCLEADLLHIEKNNKPLRASARANVFSRIFQFLYPRVGFSISLNVATIHHRLKNILLKILNK